MTAQWEYSYQTCLFLMLTKYLVWHGERGWELVSVVKEDDKTYVLFFKRPKII